VRERLFAAVKPSEVLELFRLEEKELPQI